MRMIDLAKAKPKPSIDEILGMVRASDTLLISGTDGVQYVLEEADVFEREIAALGRSGKFMNFLRQRSEEKGGRPLSEIAEELNIS